MVPSDVPLDGMTSDDPGFGPDADDMDGFDDELDAVPDALAGKVSPERWEAMDPEDRALVLDVHQSGENSRVQQIARALSQAQQNGAAQKPPETNGQPAKETVEVGRFRDYSDEDLTRALANAFSAQQKVLSAADEDDREAALAELRNADPNTMVQIMEDLVARAAHRAEKSAAKMYEEKRAEERQAQQAETRLARSITSACGHDQSVLQEGHPVRARAEKLLEDATRQTGSKGDPPTAREVYQAFRQAYAEMRQSSRGQKNSRDSRIQDAARQSASRKRDFDRARRKGNEVEANTIAITQMLQDPRFE